MNTKSLVLNETNVKEIESLIQKLPNKTSYGHDSISNVMLEQLSDSISFPLMIIFNQSIVQGRFLDSMKKAEIIPLFKGKESDQVVNYRPISLLITISKVLEKIIYKRLYKFINKHDILYQSQYGFRNKHSCEQAILELTGRILHARDNGLHAAALFLDLSKAFDTLNHNVLLQKLHRYGVRGVCLDWFQDYLTNRSLVSKMTTLGNVITRSESYDIAYGTAQGSCLSPLLFILFCNDIYLLPMFSKIILFADDTTLVNSAKNVNFLRYTLEHDMSLLIDWYKANQLSLIGKTVLIKFWPNNDKEFRIKIGQAGVINQTHTKFLGVTIDDQ